MTDSIGTAVQSEISALAHRHLTLTFGLVGTLVLFMVLMGFGGYMGLKHFEAQLSKQDDKDDQYQSDRKTFLDTLTAHDAERTGDKVQIVQLQAQISKRDSQPLPKVVQAGLQPDSTSQAVAGALQSVYSDVPSFGAVVAESPTTVALSLPQAQQMVKDKASLSTTRADLTDEKSTISLLNTANASLSGDLNQCK